MKQTTFFKGVLQTVMTTAALTILSGTIKVYLDVHDLKLMVAELKGKQDWLFSQLYKEKSE